MNEPFVPLSNATVSGRNRSNLLVTIVNQNEMLQAFHPLARTGKSSASGQCLPRVTLQRDGDRVSSIRIQCSCGQVVELTCAYESSPVGKILNL